MGGCTCEIRIDCCAMTCGRRGEGMSFQGTPRNFVPSSQSVASEGRWLVTAFALVNLLFSCSDGIAPAAEVVPLEHAHAHNDYLHTRPLLDALDHGFTSVEVDIFLVDGELLVAHTAREIKPDRTLEKLYLEP